MEQILQTILSRIGEKSDNKPFLIAIDGRSAAGKSTISERLKEQLSCPLVHMDEFFLRPEQRVPSRFQMPGGNVDHERFLTEVLQPMAAGKPFSYRPFNCHTMDFDAPVSVPESRIYVVEGSYSCHPALRKYYDLRIFLSISPEEQRRRICSRNGEEQAQMFFNRWIPLEEQYFDAFDIADCADLVFEY